MYAVAVRDAEDLFLFLRIRRAPTGDAYVVFPRNNRDGWDPHSSYHKDGHHHQKSFDRKFMERQGAEPNENFKGTANVVTTPIAASEPRAINMPCKVNEFSRVFEIPLSEVRPEKYKTHIAVDLCEPGGQPTIAPGARIVRQAVFDDAVPWILVTLFEG